MASGSEPVISIIVVSFNTRDLTTACLRSVVAETRTGHEVIVVDNASSDGSAEAVAEAFPGVRLLAETENHGFAVANNLGARVARGSYLLLLNPDTLVLDGAIDSLLEFARSAPAARIWGGRTLFADRTLNPTNAWREMSLWSLMCRVAGLDNVFDESPLFNAEGYGGWRRDTEREVDIVTGCFLLIERQFWNELGGFDPTYVMYGEEADLCLRARASGARPRITPLAEIVHYGGASETVVGRKHVMLLQAKATLVRRFFPGGQRSLGLALLGLWPLSRTAVSGFVARLTGRPEWVGRHEKWREVWRRRGEWRRGYPDLSA